MHEFEHRIDGGAIERLSPDALALRVQSQYEQILSQPENLGIEFNALRDLDKVGITKVQALFTALVFRLPSDTEEHLHLWIGKPKQHKDAFDDQFQHGALQRKLEAFLRENRETARLHMPYSSFLVIDQQGGRNLIISQWTADMVENDLKSGDDAAAADWERLFKQYRIDRLIGALQEGYASLPNIIHGEAIFENMREEQYFVGLAQRFGMTNFEFLRFHQRARSVWQVQQPGSVPISYEALAREVVDERTDESWQELAQL